MPEVTSLIVSAATPELGEAQTSGIVGTEGQEIKNALAPSELTKATTLRLAALQPQQKPAVLYAPSVSEAPSSVASSYAVENLPVQIPPRPKGKNGEPLNYFECPYCSVVQFIKNDRSWK